MKSHQTRRRLLALAALTTVTVVTGSIAVADGPTADDIASDALADTPTPDAGLPTDLDEVVEKARTVRETEITARANALAAADAASEAAAEATPEPTPEPTAEATPEPEPEPTAEATTEPVTSATATWVASWYGPGFHGNLTANGEVFDQWAMTAAHKTLPFGTEVQVTNPSTGATVVVRINDRGPFTAGRDIDLSRAAAEAIGISGVGSVQVAVL